MSSQNNASVGYDQSIFVKVPSGKFECPLCLMVLNNPKQCSKGHCFCSCCISTELKNRHKCPICQNSLELNSLADCLVIKDMIDEMETFCPTSDSVVRKATDCCPWKGELHMRKTHIERDCGFVVVDCPTIGCKSKIQKRKLEAHMESKHGSPPIKKQSKPIPVAPVAPKPMPLPVVISPPPIVAVEAVVPIVESKPDDLITQLTASVQSFLLTVDEISLYMLAYFNFNYTDLFVVVLTRYILLPVTSRLCNYYLPLNIGLRMMIRYVTGAMLTELIIICLIGKLIKIKSLSNAAVLAIFLLICLPIAKDCLVSGLYAFGLREIKYLSDPVITTCVIRVAKPVISIVGSLLSLVQFRK